MIVDIIMPNIGLTVTEAKILNWSRRVGERVKKGETLFEIETDKAVLEVESANDGIILALLAEEGATVPLGQVVAKLGTEAGDRWESAMESGRTGEEERVEIPTPRGTSTAISPRARRTAEQLGVDVNEVKATGAEGKHIVNRDVLQAAQMRSDDDETVSVNRVRRMTAERTAFSFREIPHFYLTQEMSAEALLAFYKQLKESTGERPRISLTDLLLKALALSLRANPALNMRWTDNGPVPLKDVDVGLAVDSPRGLLVPVLHSIDTLALSELAQKRAAMVERAKAGRLWPEDLVDGSITLSNLGTLGIDNFQAIINPPQSGILAVGAVKPRPFVHDERVTVSNTVHLTLSVDHRIVDGVEAARFMQCLTEFLGKPVQMCL